MSGASVQTRPRVLIYRDLLLPPSETFVAEQAAAFRRYFAVFAGTRRHSPGGLPVANAEIAADGAATRLLRIATRRPSEEWLSRLRGWSPRLVHAHFGYDGFLAVPVARNLGVPLAVTFHGYDATIRHSRSPLHMGWYLLRRRVFERATRIIAVSNFIRDELLLSGCPPEKIAVRYIGVDMDRFTPGAPFPRERLIVFVGRLVEKKGCGDLIDAMHRVVGTAPGAQLAIIGDGPLRPELERRAAPLGTAVRFLGHLPHRDVATWIRRASILCAPSQRTPTGEAEGLPTTIVEALACATPVVATRHAGIPEAVEDGVSGFLVPERTVTALADALVTLLREPDLAAAMSGQARARAVSTFSLAACTAALEDVYDEVADQR
jgi:glycosyltransferase involved in cell wall biosynthesis